MGEYAELMDATQALRETIRQRSTVYASNYFLSKDVVTDDFLPERASQQQAEREEL